MFKEIQLSNFRLFPSLRISGLKRINFIVGRNGCGKTSVLEAVFLLAGSTNPQLITMIHALRGENIFHSKVDYPFRTFFYDLDPTKIIKLIAKESIVKENSKKSSDKQSELTRQLTITPITQVAISSGSTKNKELISGMHIKFKGPTSKGEGKVYWEITKEQPNGQLKYTLDKVGDHIIGRFVSARQDILDSQIVNALNDVIREKNLEEVLDVLRILEPKIENLVTIADFGVPNIYIDVGKKQLIPLVAAGSGFLQFLRIALWARQINDGILIVDEIEVGLHYTVVKELIRMLFKVAEKNNIQLFISTHSEEVVRALGECIDEEEYTDIALVKLLLEKSEIKAKVLDFSDISYSKNLKIDLR